MIFTLFNMVNGTVRNTRMGVMKCFACAACPDAEKPILDLCYNFTAQIEQRLAALTSGKSEEMLEWVGDILQESGEQDGGTYNEFLLLLISDAAEYQGPPEEEGPPPDAALVKHARDYLESFEKLSGPVQTSLNRSLKGQAAKLMDYIESALEKLDEDYDYQYDNHAAPGPHPHP